MPTFLQRKGTSTDSVERGRLQRVGLRTRHEFLRLHVDIAECDFGELADGVVDGPRLGQFVEVRLKVGPHIGLLVLLGPWRLCFRIDLQRERASLALFPRVKVFVFVAWHRHRVV